MKIYKLLDSDQNIIESETPGTLGGNSKAKIYGELNCGAAIRALPDGYRELRVFFADEATAIAAGYRPCGSCMRERYRQWAAGGQVGTAEYPWLTCPSKSQKA